jgi:hypothetical protein
VGLHGDRLALDPTQAQQTAPIAPKTIGEMMLNYGVELWR